MKKIINFLAKVGIRLTPYQRLKYKVKNHIKVHGLLSLEKWIKEEVSRNNTDLYTIYRVLFFSLKPYDIKLSIHYGDKAYAIQPSEELKVYISKRKKLMYKQLYNTTVLRNKFETSSIEEVDRWIKQAIRYRPELKLNFYKSFFTFYKSTKPLLAIQYGRKAIVLGADEKFKKVVETRERWIADKENFLKSDFSDLSVKELRDILDEHISVSIEKAILYLDNIYKYDKNLELVLKIYWIRKINKDNFELTVQLGESILDRLEDKSILKVISARAYALHDYNNAYIFYKKYFELHKDTSIIDRYIICIFKTISLDEDISAKINDIVEEHFKDSPKRLKRIVTNKLYFEYLFLLGQYDEAVKYGLRVIKKDKKLYPIRVARAFFEMGEISKALSKSNLNIKDEKHNKIIKLYQSYLKLLDNGFAYSQDIVPINNTLTSKKVLYVLNNSLPYHSNGYSTRGHGLLKGVKQLQDIHCVTRLGYPHDLAKFRQYDDETYHQVDGIDYYHLTSKSDWLNYIPLDEYLTKYGEKLYEHILKHNIRIIHSASNFVNAIASNYAAKKAGIKSIYEVRGLWEITRISRQPDWENSEHFNMIKRLETQAAKDADLVVTITHALKDELIKRGVEADKISVLPNGVDSQAFVPLNKDNSLTERLDIGSDEVIIGYIGSIVEYEGIDLLIEAIAKLQNKGIDKFKFLLVGDGRYFSYIKELVKKLDVEENVIITGRIPHEEVENYYSIIDIAPLPRKAVPVSEMVSPLKPFEAMAMGKVVLGSNVNAIAEIIEEGNNGFLFEKSNVDDLADKLEYLITNEDLRIKVGKQAREWVVKERDWNVLAQNLIKIYKGVLNG